MNWKNSLVMFDWNSCSWISLNKTAWYKVWFLALLVPRLVVPWHRTTYRQSRNLLILKYSALRIMGIWLIIWIEIYQCMGGDVIVHMVWFRFITYQHGVTYNENVVEYRMSYWSTAVYVMSVDCISCFLQTIRKLQRNYGASLMYSFCNFDDQTA